MPVKSKAIKYLIFIFALFTAAYVAHNLISFKENTSMNCLETGIQASVRSYYYAQESPSAMWREMQRCIGPMSKKGGIYKLFCMLSYAVFGVSAQSAVYVNFFLLLLLIFSVYKIGKISKDGYFGLLACFQLLMYPAVFGFLRISFISFATLAFVAFGIYCLLSSDYFRSIYKLVLFAVCVIILLKLKMEKGVVYLLAPTAIYLFHSYRANGGSPQAKSVFYRNLLIFVLTLTALAAVLTSSHAFILRIKYYLTEVYGESISLRIAAHPSMADTCLLYLKDLYFIQAGELGFIFFALGAIFFVMSDLRHKLVLASWVVVPYVFHSGYYYFSGIHASYYSLEYMPAIALISSCAIYYICRRSPPALRAAICITYISLELVNYVAINHYNKQLPFLRRTKEVSFIGKIRAYSPIPEDEQYFNATQELIDKIIAVKGKNVSVVFVNHYPVLLAAKNKIVLHNVIRKNGVFVYDFSDLLFNLEKPDDAQALRERLNSADLIVDGNRFYPDGLFSKLKNYTQFDTAYDFSQQVRIEEKELNEVIGNFVPVKEISNPKMDITFFVSRKISDKI